MPRKKSDSVILAEIRQVITEWQLARGATKSWSGVADDAFAPDVQLPDRALEQSKNPNGSLTRIKSWSIRQDLPPTTLERIDEIYRLPGNQKALKRIEAVLGMTLDGPSAVRNKFTKWLGVPDAKP